MSPHARHVALASGLSLLLVACTGGRGAAPPSAPAPSSPAEIPLPTSNSLVLDVVIDTSSSSAASWRPYLDGIRVAIANENRGGGIDGRPFDVAIRDDDGSTAGATAAIAAALDDDATAILYAGPGGALLPLRARLEQTHTPVVLMGGDLYTPRTLFREVFQTTIPWEWQANVIARYVVRDRKADDVVFIGEGENARIEGDVLSAAFTYWGGHLSRSFVSSRPSPLTPVLGDLHDADWVVIDAPPGEAVGLVNAVEEETQVQRDRQPFSGPGITASPAVFAQPDPPVAKPEPGTSACYTYTWAGWAEPIGRVGRFRRDVASMFGHEPTGLEQEGYDGVSAVVAGLRGTGGKGGAPLLDALESLQNRYFSSFPVSFGPDDHLFLPRDQLGLFAVAGPDEEVDPWEEPGSEPWRPVMRTFTYDGERDSILDRDRPVFFPFWEADQPGPEYWRSRYGIVSRPKDPLH